MSRLPPIKPAMVGSGAAALALVAIGVGAYAAQGSSAAESGCPSTHQQAMSLVRAGDRAGGAALPLQQSDKSRFRVAAYWAIQTELRGYRIMDAQRQCFTGAELEGLDQHIEYSEHRLDVYAPRPDFG